MKDELALVDSNILGYVFDENEPKKSKISSEMVAACWKRKRELVVSIQNLSEFYVVVTRKISNPLPAKLAKDFIEHIIDFQGWHIINYNANTIKSAIDINMKYKIHYWDALLAATMKENNIYSIYTENGKDFKKIPWMKTIDPFENLI